MTTLTKIKTIVIATLISSVVIAVGIALAWTIAIILGH